MRIIKTKITFISGLLLFGSISEAKIPTALLDKIESDFGGRDYAMISENKGKIQFIPNPSMPSSEFNKKIKIKNGNTAIAKFGDKVNVATITKNSLTQSRFNMNNSTLDSTHFEYDENGNKTGYMFCYGRSEIGCLKLSKNVCNDVTKIVDSREKNSPTPDCREFNTLMEKLTGEQKHLRKVVRYKRKEMLKELNPALKEGQKMDFIELEPSRDYKKYVDWINGAVRRKGIGQIKKICSSLKFPKVRAENVDQRRGKGLPGNAQER